jgi:hypothetical protein
MMPDPMTALEKIITEAQQEGKFEDLQGKGKPLEIDTSPDAVIKGILKEANVSVAPEWITLAMAIDRLLEQGERALEAFAAEHAAGRAALMGSLSPAPSRGEPEPQPVPDPHWRQWWRTLLRSWSAAPPFSPAESRQAEAGAALQRRWDRELERHAAWLHDCNRKIRRFNQIVPLANRQRTLLPVKDRLQEFVERYPRPERGTDGAWQFTRGVVPATLLTPRAEDQQAEARPRDPLQVVALQRMRQRGRTPPPIG